MPVDNSSRGAKRALLEEVSEQCGKLRRMGDVFLVGDFNARVGKSSIASGNVVGAFGEDT